MKQIKIKLKSIAIILFILTPFNPFLFLSNNNSYDIINGKTSSSENNVAESEISKIDPKLLEIMNSNKKEDLNVPIIILYNYHDENFKDKIEEESNGQVYNYKIIPATSVLSSNLDIYSIAKSSAVKKIVLDKKVYPLSVEKRKIIEENRKDFTSENHYIPLLNQSVSQISAPYLWDLGFNGSGVLIAVLDTGIDKTHPDLNDLDDNPLTTDDDKVIYERSFIDFDYNGIPEENTDDRVGHGTHVAGIISGTGEASSYTFKGVAPGSRLMNVKVLTTYGGFESWIIKGIEYAVYGDDEEPNTDDDADIISMSLGGSGFMDDPLVQAVEAAWDKNKTVVIAAGNSGDNFFTIESPGLSAKAITVGAVNSLDQVADFSSRGPSPDLRMGIDICAPGVDIVSALANQTIREQTHQNYISKSGTSMATPFVAGSLALLLQSNSDLMPTALKTALMTSAVDLGVSSYIQGSGRLDINAAYNLLVKSPKVGTMQIKRTNLINSLEIGTNELYGEIDSPFYSEYFCDWHQNKTRGRVYNDMYETFFAIRYNSSKGPKFYLSTELIVNYPREMRWLVQNSTHKIATESLTTPDGILKIDVFYEIYTNSKWLRISFKITSLAAQDVEDINFYYYMDPDIYGFHALDDEEDSSDDAEFIDNINALVANDTYYDEITNPKYGFYPNNFFGFSSMNQSIAFEVGSYSQVYSNLISNTLTNNTNYHGDVALVQQWLNLTISPNNHKFIPIILAFGNNRSNFIDNINIAKNMPFFKFENPDICINTLSISNPIYNGTNIDLNISITNVGFSTSSKLNVSTFIDNVEFNKTEIGELFPDEKILIKIPIVFYIPGSHNLTIIADYSLGEFEDSYLNNKLKRNLKVITPYLVTLFPYSPIDNPLNLKYAGQYFYWNCCILKGENFSDLKLNKTGNGKMFFSFNGNPTSNNGFLIKGGIGKEYVNISVYIPKQIKGSYQLNLQLLNSNDLLYEIPIKFEIFEDIPAQLIIINSTIEDEGPEDDDGVVEGEEWGEVSFCIKSVNASQSTYLFEPFMIVSAKNDSSIDIMNYRILFEEYSLSPNETSWNEVDYPFIFSVPYNYSNLGVKFNSIIFVQVGYSSQDYIPYFQPMFNFTIKQRVPGIPDLEFDSYMVIDFDSSDNDGLVEPGEVGAIEIYFKNIGDGSALQIFNTNFSCSDSRVIIPQPYYVWHIFIFRIFIPTLYIQWNGIDPGDITKTYSSFPVFILSSSIPPSTVLNFELEIEYCNTTGDLFKETLQFNYIVPSINGGGVGDDDNDDDDNGNDDSNMIILGITLGISSVAISLVIVSFFHIRKKRSKKIKESLSKLVQKNDIE